MPSNFNPVIAMLCLTTLNQMSELSHKEAVHQIRKKKPLAIKPGVNPVELGKEGKITIIEKVTSGSAQSKDLEDCAKLVFQATQTSKLLCLELEKMTLRLIIEYISEKPDITSVKALIEKNAKLACDQVKSLKKALNPLSKIENFSGPIAYLDTIVATLDQAMQEPGGFMLQIFQAALESRLNKDKIRSNFVQTYKEFKLLDKNSSSKIEATQTREKLFLSTVRYRVAYQSERVFEESTEWQSTHLEEHAQDIFKREQSSL